MTAITFPALAGDAWAATKKAMHAYSKVVGAVPRVHAESHPKWWHISLKVTAEGLSTQKMPLPDGGTFQLRMDLKEHVVAIKTDAGASNTISMTAGLSANQMAEKLFAALEKIGVSGEYLSEKYASDEMHTGYDPVEAEKFLAAVNGANDVFDAHRANLNGEIGPVQLWPHGFDLAFEWFGTRVERYEEHGKMQEFPSQLNLGFSPGEPSHPAPYFYSNPWPFEKDILTAQDLPSGAVWFTDGWQGSLLEYAAIAGDEAGKQKLADYAKAVYDISSPTLMT